MRTRRCWPFRVVAPALLAAVATASGCALVGYPSGRGSATATPSGPSGGRPAEGKDDPSGPPMVMSDAPDPDRVPDAVPKAEPLSPYGNMPEYKVDGHTYHVLKTAKGYDKEGTASWYGPDFHGKRTSSGETYDMYAMTAAHRTLPLPTYVEVTNLENGKSVVVRVNDRGPFHSNRIIDLSYIAALKLGIVGKGTAKVRVRALKPYASDPDGGF